MARVVKLLRFAAWRAGEEKLLQAASSLTFTTVLAIVPLLAVALALFTAFPLFRDFQHALENFLTNNLMPPAVADNIMNYLNRFAKQASRLTAIGGMVLVVISVMLIMTIDKAFNDIWHVNRQRPLPQRVLVYWAVITLGPLLAGASLWTTSFLARESMGLVGDISTSVGVALSFLPLVLFGLWFTALFVIVPNRHVEWHDALAGGFGAAIVLEIMKAGFAYYVTRFPAYAVIYGAFATLPVFLLWIYLSWVAVLFGATVAASLPLIRLGRWEVDRRPGAAFIDAVEVLRALYAARGNLPAGRSTRALASRLRLHYDELAETLETLLDMGYVVRTQERGRERWVMACDPLSATLAPVVDRLLLDRGQPRLQGDPALQEAIAEILNHSEPRTLDTLLREPAPRGPVPQPARLLRKIPGSKETHHAESQ